MHIKELLSTKPHELASKQHAALKKHVIDRIKDFQKLINEEKYTEAESELGFSGSGDGYGSENYYLDFSETGLEDIGGVLEQLKALKESAKESK